MYAHTHTHKCSGFTLIELLVVVAIIVVLISILVPAFERAQDAAQTAICQSNFHNMDLAARLYLTDHTSTFMNHRAAGNSGADDGDGDTAPGSGVRETDGTKEKWWATDLFKYGMTPEAYHCAGMKGSGRSDWGYSWQWEFSQDKIGYGYNGFFLGIYPYNDPFWTSRGYKFQWVVQPSFNLIFGETQPVWGAYWSQSLWWPSSVMEYHGNEGISVDRHGKGSVAGFNDGHNEVVRAKVVNPPYWASRDYHPISAKYWDPEQRRGP